MNRHRRSGFGRLIAIPAFCLGAVCTPAVTAQEVGGDTVRVCTFPAAGFFARDRAGAASGFEYDLLTGFAAARLLAKHFGEANADFLAEDVAKASANP